MICRIALWCWVLVAAGPAWAGSIHFGLARTGDRLQLTNNGDSTAFYPLVLRLGADGQWLPLQAMGTGRITALAPGAQVAWHWRSAGASGAAAQLANQTVPVMVRFFDQAGADFGQISFFNQPLIGPERVSSTYRADKLILDPPAGGEPGWRRSWLLWGREAGIAGLTGVGDFEHVQPPAQTLDWQTSSVSRAFDLGGARPPAWLVHETASGFELQVVSRGGEQGREQRAAWLDAGGGCYGVALATGGLAALLSTRRRRREAP